MTSVRLTIKIRQDVINDLVTHRFRGEIDALNKKKRAFADLLYMDIYPTEMKTKMESLEDGWLPTIDCLAVQFGGATGYQHIHFDGREGLGKALLYASPAKDDERDRPILARHRRGCVRRYDTSHFLSQEHAKLAGLSEDIGQRVNQAYRSAQAALNSVFTVNSLIKHWPEVEPFTKSHSMEGANLPALATQHLNEMFQLVSAA